MLEAILSGAGCIAVLAAAWLLYRPWAAHIDRQVAEEQARFVEEGKELDAIRYILDAPDTEYEGMDLQEAMRVTRKKLEAG